MMRFIRLRRSELALKSANLDRRINELVLSKKRAFNSFQFARELPRHIQKMLSLKRRNLENVNAQLESLHPKRILSKGYSIIFSQIDGSVISSISGCRVGQAVKIAFVDGEAEATITNLREDNNDKSKS